MKNQNQGFEKLPWYWNPRADFILVFTPTQPIIAKIVINNNYEQTFISELLTLLTRKVVDTDYDEHNLKALRTFIFGISIL